MMDKDVTCKKCKEKEADDAQPNKEVTSNNNNTIPAGMTKRFKKPKLPTRKNRATAITNAATGKGEALDKGPADTPKPKTRSFGKVQSTKTINSYHATLTTKGNQC